MPKAKCKLCSTIIEPSKTMKGFVICICAEIGISEDNGKLLVYARDYNNLLKVDDDGKEYATKILSNTKADKESTESNSVVHDDISSLKPDRQAIIETIDGMVEGIQGLPQHAKMNAITHYDFEALLLIMKAMIKDYSSDSS